MDYFYDNHDGRAVLTFDFTEKDVSFRDSVRCPFKRVTLEGDEKVFIRRNQEKVCVAKVVIDLSKVDFVSRCAMDEFLCQEDRLQMQFDYTISNEWNRALLAAVRRTHPQPWAE